jgi:hypothetical protein
MRSDSEMEAERQDSVSGDALGNLAESELKQGDSQEADGTIKAAQKHAESALKHGNAAAALAAAAERHRIELAADQETLDSSRARLGFEEFLYTGGWIFTGLAVVGGICFGSIAVWYRAAKRGTIVHALLGLAFTCALLACIAANFSKLH